MARRDRAAPSRGTDDAPDDKGGGLALDTASNGRPRLGPHDCEHLDPEVTDATGIVDFGAIRVPVPAGGTVTVEPTANGRMQAVHIALPEGRLSVSALAAPKSSKLWPELSREIDASLREGGARVRSFTGDWGRELHATSGGATSVFVGVDGPRWMLYGVATGPTDQSLALDADLRRMLRGTVVVRGKQPYPVRTILPLVVPSHLAAEAADAAPAPAVAAAGAKKKSAAKSGAGKSAPGRTAPGKTSAKPDAASAAAKKAAARRAAARKAAATAAVKAAAAALAEQAAEDRAAAGARAADAEARSARGSRTGAHPDVPPHEQAPSARRAAPASWRPQPAEPTEALPAANAAPPDLRPAEGPRLVEPGSGGRRRLREQAPAAEPPPGGRRHPRELVADEPRPAGRRRLPDPDVPAVPEGPGDARRPKRESAGTAGATGPWDARRPPEGVPEYDSGDRWDRVEPGPRPDAPGGRRRLREPLGEPRRAGVDPWESGPAAPAADAGVSASGRRRSVEPWDEDGRAAGPSRWDTGADPLNGSGVSGSGGRRRLVDPLGEPGRAGVDPSAPAADAGVSASGRRRLVEPWDEDGRAAGPSRWEPGPDGLNGSGVSGSGGRRRLVDPLGEPGRAGADAWESGPAPGDAGVSASGRRRLVEPSGEPPWGAGTERRDPWASGPDGSAMPGSGGRRRVAEPLGEQPWETGSDRLNGSQELRSLGEPDDELARGAGAQPRGTGAGPYTGRPDGPWARAGDRDVSAPGGRRRVREPFGEPGRLGDAEPWETAAGGGWRDRGDEPSAGGRRHLWEPSDEPGLGGPGPEAPRATSGGRRRQREPFGEPEPYGRPEAVDDLLSGTGGRRRRREPDPARPVRDGSSTEPWRFGPGGPRDDRGDRRARGEHLVETGEQDADWAARLDGYAEPNRGGRHSGAEQDDAPHSTARLRALIGDLDRNRPSGRHRR